MQTPTLVSDGSITIGARTYRLSAPPAGFRDEPALGLLLHEGMTAQRIHARPPPDDWAGEARAIKTPAGDYLVMFTSGQHHYGRTHGQRTKVNDMVAYRSADGGGSWSGPTVAWEIPHNQHGWIPFVPRGTHTLYAFGTEPTFDEFEEQENAPIGFRTSDDDGHTWSEATLIRPVNDPGFRGMSLMRMCETGDGTWLVGSHDADWSRGKPISTRQYLLRSEDRGATWALLPGKRPHGWFVPGLDRMDEGRPIALDDGRVLVLIRTPEGHLWETRSDDHGRTWTEPQPTTLIHPDAPPMVFHLSDGRTLAAFHHNRHTGQHFHPEDRSELWVSLSTDEGHTWSAPRFVLANSALPLPGREQSALAYSVSYVDAFPDAGALHLFISHQFRQVLYVRFDEALLADLPDQGTLAMALTAGNARRAGN